MTLQLSKMSRAETTSMHFVINAWKMNASGSLEPICNLFEAIMIFITINNNNYSPRYRALISCNGVFFLFLDFMFSHDYNELLKKCTFSIA